ncbi:4-hydroxyproline 2-epimerase [Abditibacteriota bacterium]|nr:4-hydroxyproline 2-epimerase [Abditibacteriota bacterium]
MSSIHIIDSHTEGEPTRLVVAGGPELGEGSLSERREIFRRDFDAFRSAVVNEPRGADHIVGALLCQPSDASCTAGVIFFNNTGYLQMCGHGTIGLVVTLAHLDLIGLGKHRIETPVGTVTAQLHEGNRVSVANVPAYRFAKAVQVEVEGVGSITGDIAWGGNWFFLVAEHGQELSVQRVRELTEFSRLIKEALAKSGITGHNGAEIDHVELFGPPSHSDNHSRNFVLCPGDQYDRSPCGTGTSAKLACLYADGKIQVGQIWRQESILGTVFEGQIQIDPTLKNGTVLPIITGTAYVTADAKLLRDMNDPLRDGVRF